MKVVLLKSIPKLGQAGDIKDVSDGYARNYLLPNQLAVLVTNQRLAELQSSKLQKESQSRKVLLSMERARQMLNGKRFEFNVKSNPQGTLFAGVTASCISDILKGEEYDIKPTMVDLPHPLKYIGDHEVVIDFGDQKRAVITISIIPSRDH